MKPCAVVACAVLLAGCFGYNSSAKKWAYVGDSVLILGGGAAIGADVATAGGSCMPATGKVCEYQSPIDGALLAGALLVTAGIVGIVYNATRAEVKTSR